MKVLNKKRFDLFLKYWKLGIPVVLASLFSLYQALSGSGQWNFLILWLLGTLMCFCVVTHYDPSEKRPAFDLPVAWISLGGAFLGLLFNFSFEWCLLTALFSFSVYLGSIKTALKLLVPYFILLVMTPEQVFYNMAFSYPLRVLAAFLTAFLLRLIGWNVECSGMDLSMDQVDIAITAACSGIEQLEIMLLLGFILVLSMQRRFLYAFLQYLMILPALVAANVCRLTATLILYRLIGDTVFDSKIHQILGYGMVAVAFLFLYFGGILFRDDPVVPENPAEKDPALAKEDSSR